VVTALDRRNGAENFLVDYRECSAKRYKATRLVVLGRSERDHNGLG
jgi:hypothetical protein